MINFDTLTSRLTSNDAQIAYFTAPEQPSTFHTRSLKLRVLHFRLESDGSIQAYWAGMAGQCIRDVTVGLGL